MNERRLFDGKTILVTGASSGLGAHFCAYLKSEGARVIGLARRDVSTNPDIDLAITGCMSASLAEPVVSHYKGQDIAGMAKVAITTTNTTMGADGSAGVSSDPSTADRLLAEAAAHLKLHLAPQLSGAQKYSALMAANAIRLARGALSCASSDRSAATDPVIEDLVFELRIWSFKG